MARWWCRRCRIVASLPLCGWRFRVAVRVKKNEMTGTGMRLFILSHCHKRNREYMDVTIPRDRRGRRLIYREWHNTDGQLHRTTGPAVEEWTMLPDGAHVLSYQAWFVNGKQHNEGRPAVRSWRISEDGTRSLEEEWWFQYGKCHRAGAPARRTWTVPPDGIRTLAWETWRVNAVRHRLDGPAETGPDEFWWHDVEVGEEDLPWLRRGRSFLVALASAWTRATTVRQGDGGASGVPPAWSRDARVTTVTWHGGGDEDAVVAVYRSAVGGSMLLCV